MNKKILYLLFIILPLICLTACDDKDNEHWATPEEVKPFTGVYKGKMNIYLEGMETSKTWQQVSLETWADTIVLKLDQFRVNANLLLGDVYLTGIKAEINDNSLNFNGISNIPLRGENMNVEVTGNITGTKMNISYNITSLKSPSVTSDMVAELKNYVESDSAAITNMIFQEDLVYVQPEIDQELKQIYFYVADTITDSTTVVLYPLIKVFGSEQTYYTELDFTGKNHSYLSIWAEDSIHQTTYTIYMQKVRSYPADFENWVALPVPETDPTPWKYKYLEPYSWTTNNEWMRWLKKNGFYDIDGEYPVYRLDAAEAYKGNHAAQIKTIAVNGNTNIPYLHAGVLFKGEYAVSKDGTSQTSSYGITFDTRPVTVNGYYKYTSGAVLYNNDVPVTGETDTCCIRAILYEVANLAETLEYSQFENDPRIVATGMFQTAEEVTEYTYFNCPLVYQKDFVSTRKYKLAVVFCSSKYGEELIGAPGSTLIVDEVKIVGR